MKHRRTYMKMQLPALAALIMALASCGNDTQSGSSNDYLMPLSISAVIESGGTTRVASLDSTNFEKGDTIGLYILNSSGSAYDSDADSYNVPAVYNGAGWDILEDVYLSVETAKVMAYYPYNATYGNILSPGVPFNLTDQYDILFTDAYSASYKSSSVELEFHHLLSRITLSVSTSSDVGNITLTKAGIKSESSDMESNISLSPSASGWAIEDEDYTDEISVALSSQITTSSSKDVDILVYPCSTSGKTASLAIDDTTYTIDLPEISSSWNQGYQYTYNITAIKHEETITYEVSSASLIESWADNGASEEIEVTYEEDGEEIVREAVDLGLSVKWATCNIGASSPEEYGDYFAWGETEPKDDYSDDNSVTYGVEMDDISGIAEYDAATANWGGSWRIPTSIEISELLNDCSWEWTTLNDTNGYLITSTNGSSIFLPAAGNWTLSSAGKNGHYWSSTPLESNTSNACSLLFDSDSYSMFNSFTRYNGFSVRPVTE